MNKTRKAALKRTGDAAKQKGQPSALERPGTIQITDLESKHSYFDRGKPGTSIGDLDIYNLLLFNKRITPRALGHGEMICTRVGTKRRKSSATCGAS